MSKVSEWAADEDDSLDSPQANNPLPIVVTSAAKEELALRALVRDALPMLRRPQAYTGAQRAQVAQAMAALLDGAGDDTNDLDEGGEWP